MHSSGTLLPAKLTVAGLVSYAATNTHYTMLTHSSTHTSQIHTTYSSNRINTSSYIRENTHTSQIQAIYSSKRITSCHTREHTHTSQKHHAIYSYTGQTYLLPTKHIHQRDIMPDTLTRGKYTHYLQNTYIRETSCHILLHEENILTTSKTHTSQIHCLKPWRKRITLSQTSEHTHQRYIMPYSLQRGSLHDTLGSTPIGYTREQTHQRYMPSTHRGPLLRDRFHNTSIRDSSHVVLDGEHIVTSSTNRPIREPSLLPLVEKDDFRIDSGTAPSEIHHI